MLNNPDENSLNAIENNDSVALARYAPDVKNHWRILKKALDKKHWGCVELLLEYAKSDDLNYVLEYAIRDNQFQIARRLLAAGVPVYGIINLNSRDSIYFFPFSFALENLNPQMMALLLIYGAAPISENSFKGKHPSYKPSYDQGWNLAHTHKRRIELFIVFSQALRQKVIHSLVPELIEKLVSIDIAFLCPKLDIRLQQHSFFNNTMKSTQARLENISAAIKVEAAEKFIKEYNNVRMHVRSSLSTKFVNDLESICSNYSLDRKIKAGNIDDAISKFLTCLRGKDSQGKAEIESKTCLLLINHDLLNTTILAKHGLKHESKDKFIVLPHYNETEEEDFVIFSPKK